MAMRGIVSIVIIVIVAALLIAAAFVAGMLSVRTPVAPAVVAANTSSRAGFSPVNITIDGTTLLLTNGCRAVTFDVTEDQALSIFIAQDGSLPARPFAHELLVDIIAEFDLMPVFIGIDRFEDDIYKARVTVSGETKTLVLDARPSDAIALAVRLDMTVFVTDSVLAGHGFEVC